MSVAGSGEGEGDEDRIETLMKTWQIFHDRQAGPKAFVFLAVNSWAASDVARLRAVHHLYPEWQMWTVTNVPEEKRPGFISGHIEQNFKRKLGNVLSPEFNARAIFLDYFFLQFNWYSQNYGTNWLVGDGRNRSKIVEAFEKLPDLDVFVIPLNMSSGGDKRTSFYMAESAIDTVGFERLALEAHKVTFKDACEWHPLVRGTNYLYDHADALEARIEKGEFISELRHIGVEVDTIPDTFRVEKVKPLNDKTPESFWVVFRKRPPFRETLQDLVREMKAW